MSERECAFELVANPANMGKGKQEPGLVARAFSNTEMSLKR